MKPQRVVLCCGSLFASSLAYAGDGDFGIIVLPIIALAIVLGIALWVALVWLVLRLSMKCAAHQWRPSRALVAKVALVTPLLAALLVAPTDYFAKMFFQLLRIPSTYLLPLGAIWLCVLFGAVVWYFVTQFIAGRKAEEGTT